MAIPKREPFLTALLKESIIWDIGIAGVSGVAGIAKATKDGASILVYCAFFVCAFSIAKACLAFVKKRKDQSIHELEGCLHAIQAYLVAKGGENARVTIHIPIEEGQRLEQLVEYVGCKPANRAGRTFPAQSGVIGKAFREKQSIAVARKSDNHDDFIRELIEEYHYTEKDAKACSPGTYSWLAIPLFKDGGNSSDVECIVYADSNKRDFFTDEISQACVSMCAGIARFIRQRY